MFTGTEKVLKQINLLNNKISALQIQLNEVIDKKNKQLLNMIWLLRDKGKNLKDIQKDFFASYPKANGFLRSVQLCNIKLLGEFQNFCLENNIQFWLHAGTLIGAIRHQGFIPWDDDIDVAMLRKDFNKIRDLLKNNNVFQLNEYYHDLKGSRGWQLKYKNKDIPVFIDIVIYDFCNIVPDSCESKEIYLQKFRKVQAEMYDKFHIQLKAPQCIDIGYYHFGPYPEDNRKKVNKLYEEAQQKLNPLLENGTHIFYAIDNYPFPYPVLRKEELFPLKKINFENVMVNIPCRPEFYLQGYGNIWQIPADIGDNNHIYCFEKFKQSIESFIKEK